MNYFELHLGDYEAATAHLTALEDGIYGRLLRLYYRTEKPLPSDLKQVFRLARAQSKPERDAVQQVLADFFELQDDGWHQTRCDEEIERYQAGEPEREVKKANEDNRLKRHREERARLFKIVTDAGQHAPWNVPMSELRELAERCMPPLPATAPATPATATQTPDTNHQTPDTSISSAPKGASEKRPAPLPCPEGVEPQVWADWLQLRKAKKAPVTETVLSTAKAEATKAGMSLDGFLRVWCARGSQGLQADWLKPAERQAHAPQQSTAERNAKTRQLLGLSNAPAQGDFIDG